VYGKTVKMTAARSFTMNSLSSATLLFSVVAACFDAVPLFVAGGSKFTDRSNAAVLVYHYRAKFRAPQGRAPSSSALNDSMTSTTESAECILAAAAAAVAAATTNDAAGRWQVAKANGFSKFRPEEELSAIATGGLSYRCATAKRDPSPPVMYEVTCRHVLQDAYYRSRINISLLAYWLPENL